jgi:hypothetical protein
VSFYTVKRGDTEPLEATLRDRRGLVPLPPGTTVVFNARLRGGTKVITGPCDIVSDPGQVVFAPDGSDFDPPGLYDGEIKVTDTSGRVETFPSDGYLEIRVQETVAA